MYETHFGLSKRPFRALAAGSDVFVGPQTAATMTALKKALASPDAIVAVQGPVGVGKTTIVRRALDSIGQKQLVITVGRLQLGHDEVLELLLEELGAELPSGTVQRFTTFRRILKEQADNGTRVFLVVEDAAQLGVDALSELEALTATDAGVSEGAGVVLMGDDDFTEVLNARRLKRLKQRLRLRQLIEPLSASELMGYCKHCFRLAGKEFDEVFEPGSAEVLHRLSGGIPRIANNLVESSMTSAVDNKLERVNVAQIKLVAKEEYGLDLAEPTAETPVEAAAAVAAPAVEEPATAQPVVEESAAEAPAPPADAPTVAAEAPTDDVPELIQDTQDIPQLIQDTLPDLEVLAPDLAKGTAATAANLEAAQVESSEEEVPEWDRDPTLAELRPDLDALEHAMKVAQGLAPDPNADSARTDEESAEPVPEITLDRQIQAKIDKATEELRLEEEKRAATEEEEEPEDQRTVAEILAEAQAREKVDENSIEAQLQKAMDSEGSGTEPELPVLTIPVDPPAPAPAEPSAETPEPVEEQPSEPAAQASIEEQLAAPAAPEPVAEPPPPPPAPELVVEPPAAPSAPEPAVEQPAAEPLPEAIAPEPPALELEEPTPQAAEAESPPAREDEKSVNPELQRIAADLSRARTIDDCDDKMAETLFGEEFSAMAAEIAAMTPPDLPANDDIDPAPQAASVPDFNGTGALNVELESKPTGLDLSASQRLATVRALNANPELAAKPTAEPAAEPVQIPGEPQVPQPDENAPVSIEEQINTSITQTLKALNARPPAAADDDDDDDDDDKKSGFFSRFRKP